MVFRIELLQNCAFCCVCVPVAMSWFRTAFSITGPKTHVRTVILTLKRGYFSNRSTISCADGVQNRASSKLCILLCVCACCYVMVHFCSTYNNRYCVSINREHQFGLWSCSEMNLSRFLRCIPPQLLVLVHVVCVM